MSAKLIFKDTRFSPFFWTQFFGAFNDNFLKNALVVLITFKGISVWGFDPKALVAAAGGIFILPFFLFSPLAGQISDKFEKSKVIRMVKLWEIAITAVAAIGFVFHLYSLLLVTLFMFGLHSTFFGPVKYSIIPDLVAEDRLVEGNAYIELGTFIAILLGTILGGSATSFENSEIWISLGLFGVAVAGYFASRGVPHLSASAPDLRIEWNPVPEMKDLWKILRQKVAIFNSTLGISWFWFFGAGILSVLPIYCREFLYVDSGVVTAFLAMFTVGIGLGAIVCEKLSFGRVEIGLVPIGSAGMTVFLLDLFFAKPAWALEPMALLSFGDFLNYPVAWRLLLDFFLMSIFGGIFIVPLYTLLQERSSPQTRSRVIAANNVMNAVFMVVASLVVMAFYKFELSTAQIFLAFALMNVAVSAYIYSIVPEFTLRFYSWVLCHLMYRIEVKGIENIPKEGACLLAANHVTYVDWLFLASACRRPARFVMYYRFFTIPFIKSLFKQAKVIPIAGAKEDLALMKLAFEKVSQELKEGEVVCIFPEGQLTYDGKLSPFRPGILKIIERDPVPVIPISMSGLWGSIFSRKNKRFHWPQIWRRHIVITIGKPISPQDLRADQLQATIQGMLS